MIRRARAGLRTLAERHAAGLVLDVLDGGLGDPELGDQYHPNGPGSAVTWQRIEPAVREKLGAVDTAA